MINRIVEQIVNKLYGEDAGRTRYRVWWIPQVPGKPFYAEAPDLPTARLLDVTLGWYDIFQYENRIKPDFANAGGIQRWDEIEGKWVDVPDEDDE